MKSEMFSILTWNNQIARAHRRFGVNFMANTHAARSVCCMWKRMPKKDFKRDLNISRINISNFSILQFHNLHNSFNNSTAAAHAAYTQCTRQSYVRCKRFPWCLAYSVRIHWSLAQSAKRLANKFVKQTNCSRFIRRIFKTDRQAQANGEEIVKQQLGEMEGRRLRKRKKKRDSAGAGDWHGNWGWDGDGDGGGSTDTMWARCSDTDTQIKISI